MRGHALLLCGSSAFIGSHNNQIKSKCRPPHFVLVYLPTQVIEKLLGGNTPVLGQTSESPFTQHPHPGPLQAAPSLDREASLDGSGSTWGLERGGSAVLSLYSEPSMLSAQLQGGGPRLSRRDVMALATHHEQVSILFADIKASVAQSNRVGRAPPLPVQHSVDAVVDQATYCASIRSLPAALH
jgi:hypothetical protein